MRPRKLAGAALQALGESPRDDQLMDVFPPDDAPRNERASMLDEMPGSGRVCIECGSDGGTREGCEAHEIACFHAPSRAVSEAVLRLRTAAAEHRAASRALRALVMAEIGRDRAELDPKPPARPDPPYRPEVPATSDPCPRCAEREAEVSAAGQKPTRGAHKRQRASADQQAFAFAKEAPLAARAPGTRG
jgi:hypothetical protein